VFFPPFYRGVLEELILEGALRLHCLWAMLSILFSSTWRKKLFHQENAQNSSIFSGEICMQILMDVDEMKNTTI
jgi:hypothetical protein